MSGTGGVGGAAPSGASGVGGAASSSTSGGGLPATCVTDDAIACGGVVTGNAKGEDATIDKYGSTCLGWGATYEDRLWSFSTSTSKTVTAKVTASSGADDFDLLVLEGSCNPDACIDKSVNIGTDAVTFTAKAGVPYVIAVEFNGYQSSLGGYELTVICD